MSFARCCAAIGLLLTLATLAFAGETGASLMRKRPPDYAGAATLLRAEAAQKPRSARVQRQLGIALFKSGNAADAVTALKTARNPGAEDRGQGSRQRAGIYLARYRIGARSGTLRIVRL